MNNCLVLLIKELKFKKSWSEQGFGAFKKMFKLEINLGLGIYEHPKFMVIFFHL